MIGKSQETYFTTKQKKEDLTNFASSTNHTEIDSY